MIWLLYDMRTGEPSSQLSLQKIKDACVAHMCPKCETDHHVTIEQVIRGDTSVTWCHCRACGHSWHPVIHEQRARES